MIKKLLRIIMVCLLVAAMLGTLTGCKESMVITRILYDQKAEEVDHDNPSKVTQENPDTDQTTDQLAEKQQDPDSDRKTEEQKLAANPSAKQTGNASVKKVQAKSASQAGNDKDGDQDGKAGGEDDQSAKGSDGKGQTDKKGQGSGGSESGKSDQSKDNGEGKSDDSGSGDADPNSDSASKRQVYDSNGDVVDLPENVQTVVAADAAGAMALMLGGQDVLAGTSASLSRDSLAAAVLSDYGIGSASTYWEGTGSEPMDGDAFAQMLAEENRPDVCVGITGKNSFSGDQIKELKKAGIAYVALPALTSDDNIKEAMSILGEMIGDRTKLGGKNAEKVAEDYADYCDDLLKKVKKKASGTTCTLYISGWDSDASLTVASGDGDVLVREDGLAIVYNDAEANPMDQYFKAAGVVNNAFELSQKAGNAYAAIPININVLSDNTDISGGMVRLYENTKNSFAWYRSGDAGLGSQKFPAVIVNSTETANLLDWSKKNGIWQNFGKVTVGDATDYGFAAYDTLVRTYVRSDYDIYVNPFGVTSWTDGSAESVLESIWAAYRIGGVYSADDVKKEIKAFYQSFYGHSLTGSELDLILQGK